MKIKTLRLTVCIISSFLILSGCAGTPLPGNGMGAADTGSADTGVATDFTEKLFSGNAETADDHPASTKDAMDMLTDPGVAEQLPGGETSDRSDVPEQLPDNTTENPAADKDDVPQTMPRSDAYDMFLAGEMDVTVINGPDIEYDVPQNGTYSYKELLKTLEEDFLRGEDFVLDVDYAIFTPFDGKEGDDIMALRMGDRENIFGYWMGIIAYNNGRLEMKYHTVFGYRTYFDVYNNGEAMAGGSGGAGSMYNAYFNIMSDSSAKMLYESRHLWADWSNEVFYDLLSETEYDQIPKADASSALELVDVSKDGKVYVCVYTWSQDKLIREKDEAYIQKMVDRGAILVDEDAISEMTANTIDESRLLNWTYLETIE